MITQELKSLFSPDLKRPALPADPEDCSVLIEASIGPKGEAGEETFTFSVVTPKFLAREASPQWGRGLLIVNEFSWVSAERALQRLLAHARRNSWAESAAILNHELHWEFENYQPHKA